VAQGVDGGGRSQERVTNFVTTTDQNARAACRANLRIGALQVAETPD
jgi:hypothetical protein